VRNRFASRLVSVALFAAVASAAIARSSAGEPSAAAGRPTVRLDRLDFPTDLPGHVRFERHLRTVLRHEARRADWGAGRNNTIEYRFSVDRLDLSAEGEVLRVECTATGRLPGGKSARSKLRFSGEPAARNQLVERVLDIVARGVVTRLAALERKRRGLE
jgi:hypothetical protein